MISHYLISLIIPFISIFLQSYPRFFNKYFGVDVWTRLLEIEHVKKNHHRIPGRIKKGFIIEGYFDYPIIFPWLFSFFPKKTLLNIQGFVSPFFDSLQNILVFYITFSLTNSLPASLLAQAMYSLIPIIPIENSYLTPRSLGYLNFTLAFYPIFLFHINHNPILLIISLFFTSTLFLTHRFALQSLVFISIFFSIVDQSFVYLLNLILSFIIVVALTKGFYLRVAKGHLYNIYFWVVNYKFRFAHQIYGLRYSKKMDWVGKIYSLLSFLSPVFLFGVNIWAFSGVLFFILYFQNLLSFPSDPVFFKMSLWVVFFYLFGAVVLRIKRLIPIGEGQRYMEMASVPSVILSSVLFSYFFNQYGKFAIAVIGLLFIGNLSFILFVQIKGIIGDKNRSLTKELQDAYSYINHLERKPRVICIPHQITTMTVYNTKADVLVNADNPGLMKIQEIYPILKKSIPYLKDKYKLDYLLLRETFATLKDLQLKNPKIVYRSGDILLLKI